MPHTGPIDRPTRHTAPETRLAAWTALGAVSATLLLGAAAPTMATYLFTDRPPAAPRPLSAPLAPSVAPERSTGHGDPSVPPSRERFGGPRDTTGSEALPPTF